MSSTVGLVGARGHTGAELIRLIQSHPHLRLGFVSSRELAGQRLDAHHPDYDGDLIFEDMGPDAVASRGCRVVILALPNGASEEYIKAIDRTAQDTVVLDLSADHRFDRTWFYGLPELTRDHYRGQTRISNPGCYATAIQLAVAPLKDMLAGPPVCFGVSGYSGAGTTPSSRNDPEQLHDNLMPYSLTDHMHERECSFQLGIPVEFMPHVASYFRGLTVTCNLYLDRVRTHDELMRRYLSRYQSEPLVRVVKDAPWVRHLVGQQRAEIGGLSMAPGGRRAVIVACLDNLLKGAATQAIQNLNHALSLPEFKGIPDT
ncbi:N-acetyl-gamma-glutamyl-phosphate reductase [Oleiagrimonas sp.]|jgi:N-acetyl-gamma-glutamyl-phosphate reductase|uniref:N-acetyl-gamma-glutamyl-phosphate reductase n=1 Tax=Oleiagrimonas sp. TaxID=2010330 RepID=UPI002613BBE3|nr:N-acetyl-gamma-glutamyl-phosphate reductase [Oleiagrimonas sp.]MDA3912999.1 N-acetyl-gamma-glutamyl-phosphate reductase [Oleiagrimonas sp.]